MRRVVLAILVCVPAGCSNAPIAGALDAIWPARANPTRGDDDRPPLVPDVRPPGKDVRPPPPAAPGGESLPPPADVAPRP